MTRRVHGWMRARAGDVASLCCAGVFGLAASAAAAPVFKCVDAAGKVSYQSRACDGATTQSTLAIEPAQPANIQLAPATPASRAQSRSSPGRATPPVDEQVARAQFEAKEAQATWRRLGQALDRGDVDAALRELTPGAQERYRRVFETLNGKANPPFRFAQLGTVQHISMMGEIATLTVTRKQADGPHAYEVMMMKAPDGRWLIDGM